MSRCRGHARRVDDNRVSQFNSRPFKPRLGESLMFSSWKILSMAAVLVVAGIVSTAALFANAESNATAADTKNCCEQKMDCCKTGSACCAATQKSGCCAKGMACCQSNKGCCSSPQACCVEGKACCQEAKACCGASK